MWMKKEFKKIYPNDSYTNYIIKTIKFKIKKYTWDVIKSSYLCIRFPFLYPRNRFSDKHYNNYKLSEKYTDIFKKWNNWSKEHVNDYIDKFGKDSVILDNTIVKSDYIMKLASKKDRFLYWFYKNLETFYGVFHCIPTYTELDAMDNGWRKRFGIQFCKELKDSINKNPNKNYKKNFRILQIKEKWGEFQCYVSSYSPEVERVINKYGYLSQYVCVHCGEDAVKKTMGWICPYCEKCLPKEQYWLWIDPIYGWSKPEHKKYNEKVLEKIP